MKYLYVLPLAAVAVAAFARPEVSNKLDEISSVKVNDLTSIVKAEEVKSMENSSDEKFKVSGTVLAADTKIPVIGASVIIRGTTNGTLTDLDGKFTLTGLKKDDVIQVSFVGFQTRSVIVKDESPLTILLDDAVQNLEGMVVYAPTQKSEKDEVVVFDMPMEEVKQKEVKDEPIFQVVEEMPEFPGGMAEAMKFLAKNINYPVAAQQAKIEGRVIVQFVVERDGSVSDVKVMRGVSPELDAEAIRVVSMMPKWIPGKQRGKAVAVKYTMPIMFRLQTPEPKKEEAFQINLRVDKDVTREDVDMVKDHLRNSFSVVPIVLDDDRKNPIIIVDGEVKEGMNLSQISPATIKSISVMKNEAAIAEYGDKAKDGVISIVTKKNEK
jgi:TonB family protein